MDVRMTHAWGMRMGVGDSHFSNGFVVPSDHGTDAMMWRAGLICDLDRTRWIVSRCRAAAGHLFLQWMMDIVWPLG